MIVLLGHQLVRVWEEFAVSEGISSSIWRPSLVETTRRNRAEPLDQRMKLNDEERLIRDLDGEVERQGHDKVGM